MNQSQKLKAVKWHKVNAPSTWHPDIDEELIGFYGGRTKRDGSFGPYEVMLVLVPYKGAYMVSGTKLIQLADAAMLTRGDAVRIKYLGKEAISNDREMKMFELYYGELPTAEDLPTEEPEATPS